MSHFECACPEPAPADANEAAVATLQCVAARANNDPAWAHAEAERILMTLVPESVRDAVKAVRDNCEWWYFE